MYNDTEKMGAESHHVLFEGTISNCASRRTTRYLSQDSRRVRRNSNSTFYTAVLFLNNLFGGLI
jgi:hypothetical protein